MIINFFVGFFCALFLTPLLIIPYLIKRAFSRSLLLD